MWFAHLSVLHAGEPYTNCSHNIITSIMLILFRNVSIKPLYYSNNRSITTTPWHTSNATTYTMFRGMYDFKMWTQNYSYISAKQNVVLFRRNAFKYALLSKAE